MPPAWAGGFLTEPRGRPCGRILKLFCLSALTTHQAASWKPVSGFPEGGATAPVCGRPHPERGGGGGGAGAGAGAGAQLLRLLLVYRAPLGVAGEGFHKEPPEGWRRCESSTWGIEGVHGRRREIPGCETPRGMQLDSLRKAILFMPFEMFICVFPNIFPLPPHGGSASGLQCCCGETGILQN